MTIEDHNLALLVDGNTVVYRPKSSIISWFMATCGTAHVRRTHGDWDSPSLNSWKTYLLNHSNASIEQIKQEASMDKSEGALVLDTMNYLYNNCYSSFCIVSSDEDFTSLAARIRKQDVEVCGFGGRETDDFLIAACDKFAYFDSVCSGPIPAPQPVTASSARHQLSTRVEPSNQHADDAYGSTVTLEGYYNLEKSKSYGGESLADLGARMLGGIRSLPHSDSKHLDQGTVSALREALKCTPSYLADWVNLAEVGNHLGKHNPDLKAKNYGFQRLHELMSASGLVDLTWRQPAPNKPRLALVRLKVSPPR